MKNIPYFLPVVYIHEGAYHREVAAYGKYTHNSLHVYIQFM